MPCYLYLGIEYFVAPREFYSVGKGQKMTILALKVADPWPRGKSRPHITLFFNVKKNKCHVCFSESFVVDMCLYIRSVFSRVECFACCRCL